jgi:tetratricopeptide (TPR) repeat protein
MKKMPRHAVLIPLILLLLWTLFQSQNNFLEQNGRFLEAYRWQPWRVDLLEKAGLAAASGADYQAAIDLLLQARQRNALSLAGQQALAEAYLQTGQADLALNEFEQLVDGQAASPEVLLQMARLYHRRAEFHREAEIATLGASLAPDVAEFHWRFGLLKMAEAPLEAYPFLERVQALSPSPGYPARDLILVLDRASLVDSQSYRWTLSAQALASLGEWLLARQALERAVAFDPAYAPAWALLGEARQQTGVADSLPALEKALQLDPASASAYAYLGLYWQRQQDFIRAEQAFQRATALEPDNPYWLFNLGELALSRGQVPVAHAYFLQAVRVAPESALAWRALALFCLQTEGCLREDGLPAALKARNLAPDDWTSAETLGRVLMALGEEDSALALLARAVAMAPAESSPRFHLGLLYLRQGNPRLARQTLQEALALDPEGPLAETIRAVLARYLP